MNRSLVSLVAGICSLCSCTNSNSVKQEDLTGLWIVRKVISYNNGIDTVLLPAESGQGGYAGSKESPAIMQFTNHDEVIMGNYHSKNNRVFQYSIKGDSIILSQAGAEHISKVGNDTLKTVMEFKVDYFDKSIPHPRTIITFYYTR